MKPSILFFLSGLALILLPFTCVSEKEMVGKKRLTVWTSGDRELLPMLEEAGRKFEELNPTLEVEIQHIPANAREQKYLISMQAATSADILYMHWKQVPVFAPKQALLDLDPYIQRDNYDLQDFFKGSVEAYQYQGRQYCLPDKGSSMVLFYNKDLFDRAQLSYPDRSWTFDDFLESAKQLSRLKDVDGKNVIGCLPYDISSWFWSMGGEFSSDDMSKVYFNTPKSIEAIRYFWNFRHKWNVSTKNLNAWGSDPTALDIFESGNVGMSIGGPWNLSRYESVKDFQWDIAPFPQGSAGRQTRYAGMGYGIWSQTQHPEESWQLLKFLLSEEQLTVRSLGFTDIPARKSVAYDYWAKQEADFNVDVLLQSVSAANDKRDRVRVFPQHELWPAIYGNFIEYVDLALLNEMSIEEAMAGAQEKSERYIAKSRYIPQWYDYFGIFILIGLASVVFYFFKWVGSKKHVAKV